TAFYAPPGRCAKNEEHPHFSESRPRDSPPLARDRCIRFPGTAGTFVSSDSRQDARPDGGMGQFAGRDSEPAPRPTAQDIDDRSPDFERYVLGSRVLVRVVESDLAGGATLRQTQPSPGSVRKRDVNKTT